MSATVAARKMFSVESFTLFLSILDNDLGNAELDRGLFSLYRNRWLEGTHFSYSTLLGPGPSKIIYTAILFNVVKIVSNCKISIVTTYEPNSIMNIFIVKDSR